MVSTTETKKVPETGEHYIEETVRHVPPEVFIDYLEVKKRPGYELIARYEMPITGGTIDLICPLCGSRIILGIDLDHLLYSDFHRYVRDVKTRRYCKEGCAGAEPLFKAIRNIERYSFEKGVEVRSTKQA